MQFIAFCAMCKSMKGDMQYGKQIVMAQAKKHNSQYY